jgi:hypothetical protein
MAQSGAMPPPPPTPRCGSEAVKLLNCLGSKDTDACSAELAAFKCVPAASRRCVGTVVLLPARRLSPSWTVKRVFDR